MTVVSATTVAQAVVFDLDGVLVLSEHLWEEAWLAYAEASGHAWRETDTRHCQGLSVPEWAAYVAASTGTAPEASARGVIRHVADAYESGQVSLQAGAAAMVAAVAERVPVALASSAPRTIIEIVMDSMGLRSHFSATVSSEEVPRGKPSPDVYLEAVRRLGVRPDEAVAVEDSSNGIRAAVAAGLTAIAIEHARYPLASDARAAAKRVEHDLEGVRAWLLEVLPPPGGREGRS